jgi:membrane-associated phospholipid phosphatase
VWCLGILYSTLAVRQHVLWDVIAGAALGAAVALGYLLACRTGGRTGYRSRAHHDPHRVPL